MFGTTDQEKTHLAPSVSHSQTLEVFLYPDRQATNLAMDQNPGTPGFTSNMFFIVEWSPSYWNITGTAQSRIRNTATCFHVVPFPHTTSPFLVASFSIKIRLKSQCVHAKSQFFCFLPGFFPVLNIHVFNIGFSPSLDSSLKFHIFKIHRLGQIQGSPRFHWEKSMTFMGKIRRAAGSRSWPLLSPPVCPSRPAAQWKHRTSPPSVPSLEGEQWPN